MMKKDNNTPPPQTLVWGFIGRMGSGKTLNMTKWGVLLSHFYGFELWANYTVAGAKKFKDFRELEHKKNIIILYDEIHIDFDSRDWDKQVRYQFTAWFTQLRKRGIIFMYATQRFNTLEKRIRENTDYLSQCHMDRSGDVAMAVEQLLDTQLSTTEPSILRTFRTEASKLYGVYDTTETIKTEYYGKQDRQ